MDNLVLAMWAQALPAAGVFVAWTLTSFLCHECSKMFLTVSESMFLSANDPKVPAGLSYYRFFIAAMVTAVQCLTCLLLVRTDRNLCQSTVTTVLIASHALATLATNYSMAFIEAASTLTIKLMEPITMAIAHHVVFQTMAPVETVISIPLIIYGALIFTGVKTSSVSDASGIGLAFASNIILAVRNIAMKKLQQGSTTKALVALKPLPHIAITIVLQGLFVAGLCLLEIRGLTHKHSSTLVASVLASGLFHVAYSYISTSMVLKVMNVVSHSIANIFKRLLVVLLLYALGTRTASAGNFMGLGIAVAGLLVYTYGRLSDDQQVGGNAQVSITRDGLKRKTWLNLLILALFSVMCVTPVGRPGWMNTSWTPTRNDLYRQDGLEIRSLHEARQPRVDFSHIIDAEADPKMREFLSWRLVDHPEDTDRRSKTLMTNTEVIEEAQRILVNLMQDLIGSARHVMLLDIPVFENKGDPAIAAGEVLLLNTLNKTIVFHCETYSCNTDTSVMAAVEVNKKYPKNDLVILMHGGGNVVGYPLIDKVRRKYLDALSDKNFILFSQSIWLHGNYSESLEFARTTYSNRTNLVMLLRDRQSLEIAKKNFKGVKLILAPDLAFCIGAIPRQMPPIYDIIWLRRTDQEVPKYKFPQIPANITVDVGDWYRWRTNTGKKTLENAFLVTAEGFQFLQRGRIVVTERLHGHILSVMLNIPHVLIDNPPYLKLSSFDRTWTRGLSNTVLVSNGSQALDAALELLKRYQNSLPSLSYKDIL